MDLRADQIATRLPRSLLQSQVGDGDAVDLVPLGLDEPVSSGEGEPVDVGGEHDGVDLRC